MFTGYLLFAVCNLDDIPIRCYAKRSQAERAARDLRPPRGNPLRTWDVSGFLGAKVLRFVNGRPRGRAVFFEATGRRACRKRRA